MGRTAVRPRGDLMSATGENQMSVDSGLADVELGDGPAGVGVNRGQLLARPDACEAADIEGVPIRQVASYGPKVPEPAGLVTPPAAARIAARARCCRPSACVRAATRRCRWRVARPRRPRYHPQPRPPGENPPTRGAASDPGMTSRAVPGWPAAIAERGRGLRSSRPTGVASRPTKRPCWMLGGTSLPTPPPGTRVDLARSGQSCRSRS
jgi:hypothetical protein